MAKNIFIGIDDTARKVNNIYAGIDGTARKITKCYISVDGTAQLCYSLKQKYSWDDFKSFVKYCYANNITNNVVTTSFLQKVLNYNSSFESSAISNHIDLNQYNNFFVDNNGRGGITYWITDLSTEYYCDGKIARASKMNGYNWTNDIPNFNRVSNASNGFYLGLTSSEPTNRRL